MLMLQNQTHCTIEISYYLGFLNSTMLFLMEYVTMNVSFIALKVAYQRQQAM